MTRPLTYDHLKSRKKANVRKVWIPLDSEVADKFNEAKAAVQRAENMAAIRETTEAQAELAQAEIALEAAEAEMRDNAVQFTFRSLSRKNYELLLKDHAPTKPQIALAKAQNEDLTFNPDTFPQALVAASLVEPELTEAEVQEIFESDDWNTAELVTLFQAAMEANSTRRLVSLGNE